MERFRFIFGYAQAAVLLSLAIFFLMETVTRVNVILLQL
jgi:hypothetical protein